MTQMIKAPLVSVIIPAYNAAWCINRAVDSVLAQYFSDYELIVVNDGSTDNTAQLLATYGNRLTTISKANGGLPSARNAGIKHSRGKYIAFLDADDWWLPEKLGQQVSLLEADPGLAFCATTTEVRTPSGEHLRYWRCRQGIGTTLESIFAVNSFVAGSGSAVMARRASLIQTSGFDESLKSLEDIDMWMRLSVVGRYQCIDRPLTVIEKRGESMSGNLPVMRCAATRVMKKNRHLLPASKQGSYWRAAFAGTLTDYAKWAYRTGSYGRAAGDLLHALLLSPLRKGRLTLSLLLAMLRKERI